RPPAEAHPVLRKLWGEHGLDDDILTVLARSPEAADRQRFLDGLRSPRPDLVRAALGALEKLPRPSAMAGVRDQALALVVALRATPADKGGLALRARLEAELVRTTGERHKGGEEWAGWLVRRYPAEAKALAGDGVDVAAWERRLAKVDWA